MIPHRKYVPQIICKAFATPYANDILIRRINFEGADDRRKQLRLPVHRFRSEDHNSKTVTTESSSFCCNFPAPIILARKAQRRLINRIHRGVDKALNICGGGTSRHCHRTEGVHGRLDQNVGNREDCALHDLPENRS